MSELETKVNDHEERLAESKERLDELETRVDDHEERLTESKERLDELEKSDRIILRALMALLSHNINGNSDEKMRASLEEIQQFLIER